MKRIRYCKKCVSPEIFINSMLDEDGICAGCRLQEEFDAIPDNFWKERERKFIELLESSRSRSNSGYDCIVPVSGGKDSYYQVHKVLELGFRPLLVTYHGNNYLPEGQRNLDRMREKLGVDHLVFGPSVDTLKKLNRKCFKIMGDMNWHAHAGIKIYPMIIAAKFEIPLLIWGEITWSISGMFSPDDYVEYNKRNVFEHDMRGFKPSDMTGADEGITEKDLNWLEMPSDSEIERIGIKGIYIGNFFKWDPNVHARHMKDMYGFEFAEKPFERTYRTMSNLDDMHENGIHDYMKYIKFGYGRATDHASKDIRTGYMTRDEGIEMVKKYDHIKPRRDLDRWLGYAGMTEDEFDRIADGFRDPRVWWIENGIWWKDNIWGVPTAYEPVKLDHAKWSKYMKEAGRKC